MIKLLGEILQLWGTCPKNPDEEKLPTALYSASAGDPTDWADGTENARVSTAFPQGFSNWPNRFRDSCTRCRLDLFSKLAQLIETNQEQLKEQLKHVAGDAEKQQLLQTLRNLLEQVGFQVDKVHSNLMAREMLTQNLPVHCIPLMVHADKEAYPAELYIQQDYNPREPKQGPDSERPLKLTLTLETHNLGRVSVDLTSLKSDLTLRYAKS